jgi:hypothetical protein
LSATRRIGSALYALAWPTLVLVLGGDVRWVEGWMIGVWLVVFYAVITTWMYAKDQALLAERRRRPPQPTSEKRRIVGSDNQS